MKNLQKLNIAIVIFGVIVLLFGLWVQHRANQLIAAEEAAATIEPALDQESQVPARGSQAWCDYMLTVDDQKWREQDFTIFSQHCFDVPDELIEKPSSATSQRTQPSSAAPTNLPDNTDSL